MNEVIFKKCKKIFIEKLYDYDFPWIDLSKNSLIDQIFIKIFRVKNIQSKKYLSVKEEKIIDTYIDIINYIIIMLIQTEAKKIQNISHKQVIILYNNKIISIKRYLNDCLCIKTSPSIKDLLNKIWYLKSNKSISIERLQHISFKMIYKIILLSKIMNK
ncbi:nucleotide modification associated domain-containing protein [Blattabacterium cuenoti]|uniref:nucleotide modification associated domain-containing protein n=1 Tax=Blattabacterium cuenoti TaxID=1653831 RepID=UPI00163D2BD9|nr:nucleotide modification associated domain-containing protein [Blattabacterium cuenoti]